MSERNPGIPLAKAIQNLREEMLAALEEGRDKPLRFKMKPIELELGLVMTWSGEANAGVKFWVVDVGAKGAFERAATHTLKVTLDPVDASGSEFMIRDTVATLPP